MQIWQASETEQNRKHQMQQKATTTPVVPVGRTRIVPPQEPEHQPRWSKAVTRQ